MIKGLLKTFIRFYKMVISPVTGPSCRFYPSCSDYAYIAVDVRGPGPGLFLAVKRLLRCHPLNPGGYDPVPPRVHQRTSWGGDTSPANVEAQKTDGR